MLDITPNSPRKKLATEDKQSQSTSSDEEQSGTEEADVAVKEGGYTKMMLTSDKRIIGLLILWKKESVIEKKPNNSNCLKCIKLVHW
jgi:hypothetical protein